MADLNTLIDETLSNQDIAKRVLTIGDITDLSQTLVESIDSNWLITENIDELVTEIIIRYADIAGFAFSTSESNDPTLAGTRLNQIRIALSEVLQNYVYAYLLNDHKTKQELVQTTGGDFSRPVTNEEIRPAAAVPLVTADAYLQPRGYRRVLRDLTSPETRSIYTNINDFNNAAGAAGMNGEMASAYFSINHINNFIESTTEFKNGTIVKKLLTEAQVESNILNEVNAFIADKDKTLRQMQKDVVLALYEDAV